MEVNLSQYFKDDIAYLAQYRERLISLADYLDPADAAFLLDYATHGIDQELAFCQSAVRANEEPTVAFEGRPEEGTPQKRAVGPSFALELAALTPCFTVYAARKPFPLYASEWFQTAAAKMQAIYDKYYARYPEYQAAMTAALEQAISQENKGLDQLCLT